MQILNIILLLAACLGYTLTGAMRFLLLEGFLIFSMIQRAAAKRKRQNQNAQQEPQEEVPQNPLKRKVSPWILIYAGVFLLLFLPAPLKIHSTLLWRYPFQKTLIEVYNRTAEWFPEFKDDAESDYVYDYMPTILQGTGHESIRFVTTPERAAEIEAQFAAQAKYTVPLPGTVFSSNFCELTVPEEDRAPFADSDWDGTADFYCDYDFWFPDGTLRPDAAVYLLDARGDWNHWGSSAVIVSAETGAVQYSQLGFTYLAYPPT